MAEPGCLAGWMVEALHWGERWPGLLQQSITPGLCKFFVPD